MVSIIIPLFNTPIECLKRCLDSILQQEYKDLEIIVIDDGSADNISDEYKKIVVKYNNVFYFKQKNAGVSCARNLGVEKAKGEYIAFVDGDDIVSNNFLFNATNLAKKNNNPDLIIGDIEIIHSSEDISDVVRSNNVVKLTNEEIDDVKKSMIGIAQKSLPFRTKGTPCGRLYKTEIAKYVEFPKGITHWEDQLYNRIFLNHCTDIVVVDDVWYYYFQNDFSAMHNNFEDNYITRAKPFWDLWNKLNINEKNKDTKKELTNKNIDFFYTAISLNLVNKKTNWFNKRKIIKQLMRESIFIETKKKVNIKNYNSLQDKIRFFIFKYNMYTLAYLSVKIKKFF